MSIVGKSEIRVDAFDKATGRTKYYEDRIPGGALYVRIKHSEIAHGYVKSVDTSEAEKIKGVVKVLTCFDVPEIDFPTAGHPWSMDPDHQDVADRRLLNRHVRYYGDDVAVVIAEDEVSAMQGVRALKVEYETLPFVLDVQKAMEDGAPLLHEAYPHNILKHTSIRKGNYEEAIREPGLIKVEGWYNTPTVQHCHIENHGCFAYEENGRITVVSSTQIPHIIRRVVGQALGRPWADVEIIKPYIGGGFGNKQDALYEPLCAWCSTQVGGRLVRLDCSREETFVSNRVRHAIRFHITSWIRPDGSMAARKVDLYSNQGAYASHGHSIVAKAMGSFPQLYPCDNMECDAYTVYTNIPTAGAMRGYGMPQASFANDSNIDECAHAVHMDPVEYRDRYIMPQGFEDGFSKNVNYYDSHRECLEKGKELIGYDEKIKEFAKDSGPVRRGIGCASFWYNTAVWPIALETTSNRMLLNLDGTVTMQCGETEIGQGADTAFAQMAAEAIGLKSYRDVRVISCQDTDVTPTGLGAYASRQTYVAGFSIRQTAEILRKKIFEYANKLTRQSVDNMDIVDGNVVRKGDGKGQRAHRCGKHIHDQEQCIFVRLHVRGGRGRYPDVQGHGEEHRQRPRLRQSDQSGACRSAGARRYVDGDRLRAFRTAPVRSEDRQTAQQQSFGLQAFDGHGPSGPRSGVYRESRTDERVRHQSARRTAGMLRRARDPQRDLQRDRRGAQDASDESAQSLRGVQ